MDVKSEARTMFDFDTELTLSKLVTDMNAVVQSSLSSFMVLVRQEVLSAPILIPNQPSNV